MVGTCWTKNVHVHLITLSLPESGMETLTCTIKAILPFKSVEEVLWYDHSKETSSAVLSHGSERGKLFTFWCILMSNVAQVVFMIFWWENNITKLTLWCWQCWLCDVSRQVKYSALKMSWPNNANHFLLFFFCKFPCLFWQFLVFVMRGKQRVVSQNGTSTWPWDEWRE